ncbi:hypothetical protein DNTS_030376 [Danionella cerebrum]|uniref:Uncharacterized protein n=1 Tax=Danionella cerebrum TaxID=2873325 RepID=A0A553QWE7_9TELE|nr:hypothetical protein DNTS_030376 [Danionella translucida]
MSGVHWSHEEVESYEDRQVQSTQTLGVRVKQLSSCQMTISPYPTQVYMWELTGVSSNRCIGLNKRELGGRAGGWRELDYKEVFDQRSYRLKEEWKDCRQEVKLLSHLVAVLPLKEHRFEAVTPADLRSQGTFVHFKEGAFLVYFMHNGHRRNQKDPICSCVKADVEVCIVQWQELTLWSHPWLQRRFPTRHIMQSFPSLMATTATSENTSVSLRFLGLAILAITAPMMKASMMQPTMHCNTTAITARGQASRNAAMKLLTCWKQRSSVSVMLLPESSVGPRVAREEGTDKGGEEDDAEAAMSQKAKPKRSQESKKERVNTTNIQRQRMSTHVVKRSVRYRWPLSLMLTKVTLQRPSLPTKRRRGRRDWRRRLRSGEGEREVHFPPRLYSTERRARPSHSTPSFLFFLIIILLIILIPFSAPSSIAVMMNIENIAIAVGRRKSSRARGRSIVALCQPHDFLLIQRTVYDGTEAPLHPSSTHFGSPLFLHKKNEAFKSVCGAGLKLVMSLKMDRDRHQIQDQEKGSIALPAGSPENTPQLHYIDPMCVRVRRIECSLLVFSGSVSAEYVLAGALQMCRSVFVGPVQMCVGTQFSADYRVSSSCGDGVIIFALCLSPSKSLSLFHPEPPFPQAVFIPPFTADRQLMNERSGLRRTITSTPAQSFFSSVFRGASRGEPLMNHTNKDSFQDDFCAGFSRKPHFLPIGLNPLNVPGLTLLQQPLVNPSCSGSPHVPGTFFSICLCLRDPQQGFDLHSCYNHEKDGTLTEGLGHFMMLLRDNEKPTRRGAVK